MIIGICGGSGSGKTTFVENLIRKIGPDHVAHLPHDAYYLSQEDWPESIRGTGNFDHPEALDNQLTIDHLRALRDQKPVELPVYDFTARQRTEETVPLAPRPIILVDGVLIFVPSVLRHLFDLKIFLDADDDLRLARRLSRDISDRGRTPESILSQYLETVRAMHKEYVEPSRHCADLILHGHGDNSVALDMLAMKIQAHLADLAPASA